MLSDEEKKAIEIQDSISILENTDLDMNNIYSIDLRTYNVAVKTVLNLVKKQSKEIEELRTQIDEHVYYDLGGRSCGKTELLRHYKKGYDMNNKFWKDKIKAKIEELENYYRELYKQDNSPNEFLIGQDCLSKLSILQEVKQSLLEKE